MDSVESFFDYFRMMRGDYAPLKRAATCAIISTALVSYAQPSSMFIGGNPRPWSLITTNLKETSILPTATPWFFIPLGCALIAGVFV